MAEVNTTVTIFNGNVPSGTAVRSATALPSASASIINNPLNDADIADDDWIVFSAEYNLFGVIDRAEPPTRWIRGKTWKDATAQTDADIGTNLASHAIVDWFWIPNIPSDQFSSVADAWLGKLTNGRIWYQADYADGSFELDDAAPNPLSVILFKSSITIPDPVIPEPTPIPTPSRPPSTGRPAGSGRGLFGIDIAGIINESIVSLGGLRQGLYFDKQTSAIDTDNLTAPQHVDVRTYSCQCYASDMGKYDDDSSAIEGTATIGILGASLAVEPKIDDQIVIGDKTYLLLELINVDPAQAHYKFMAREDQAPIVIPPPAQTGRSFSNAFGRAFG